MLISSFPAGGLGPWFCALLFNASSSSKKKTHIFVHTYPHLALDSFNRTYTLLPEEKKRSRQDHGECWIMILKIGPFDSWHAATVFLETWSKRTRGKCHRMERGLELFRQDPALHMWVQSDTRNGAVAKFFQDASPIHPEKYLTSSSPVSSRGGAWKRAVISDKTYFSLDEGDTRGVLDELEQITAKDAEAELIMHDVVALHEHEATALAREKKRLKSLQ